ncbi:hypothetical protein V1522DRAFT_277844 [Lipomyces starkeyi]
MLRRLHIGLRLLLFACTDLFADSMFMVSCKLQDWRSPYCYSANANIASNMYASPLMMWIVRVCVQASAGIVISAEKGVNDQFFGTFTDTDMLMLRVHGYQDIHATGAMLSNGRY